MSKTPIVPIESPIGDLEWVIITGEGKKDLQGNMQYVASVVMPPKKAQPVIDLIDAFWAEHSGKGWKAKSMGYYDHKVKNVEETDEADDGTIHYTKTGNIMFQAKTGVAYKSGDKKIIKTFNAKGNEVSLQGKKIGNESRGLLIMAMAIYNVNPAARGVTLYLNGVQLSKFVEYTGGAEASGGIDDDDGDSFDHVEGAVEALEESGSDQPEKPRL